MPVDYEYFLPTDIQALLPLRLQKWNYDQDRMIIVATYSTYTLSRNIAFDVEINPDIVTASNFKEIFSKYIIDLFFDKWESFQSQTQKEMQKIKQ